MTAMVLEIISRDPALDMSMGPVGIGAVVCGDGLFYSDTEVKIQKIHIHCCCGKFFFACY